MRAAACRMSGGSLNAYVFPMDGLRKWTRVVQTRNSLDLDLLQYLVSEYLTLESTLSLQMINHFISVCTDI